MVITLCYDAISRNVENLGVSPFIMFTLSASAIFPACLVLLALQDRIGRKAMASSALLLSGLFTAASGFIIVYHSGVKSPELLVTLAVIGRFGVTVAYNSAAQYATELIPTCVRGQGIATVHVAGYAFTFFSSYILYLVCLVLRNVLVHCNLIISKFTALYLSPISVTLLFAIAFISFGHLVADGSGFVFIPAGNVKSNIAVVARRWRTFR